MSAKMERPESGDLEGVSMYISRLYVYLLFITKYIMPIHESQQNVNKTDDKDFV